MKSPRRHTILAVALLTGGWLLLPGMSAAPLAQASAPGAPYADPAYCKALPQLITKFETSILPQQSRELAAQETRLRDAEAGQTEAEEDFNKALRDGIIKLGTDQIGTAKVLRERVRAMKDSGMTTAARGEWLRRIKSIEDAGEQLKRGVARAEYADLVRQNQDNLVSFMQFVDESGAADPLLTGLANLVAPGIGGVVVGGIKVGLDVVYAGLKGHFTAQEAAQWRDNVDRLRAAHQDLRGRVDGYRAELTGGQCGPKVAQQVQNSPRPLPPDTAAGSTPTAPPGSSGGGSVGKIVRYSALMAGILGATAYAAAQVEPVDLGTSTGSSNTTTTANNNPTPVSNTASTIGLGAFACSVANDTSGFRSCTGSVNIRAGTLLAARQGQSMSVVVAPSAFVGTFIAPGLGGTTGTVSLRATLPRTCPTQVLIAFSPDGNSVIESIAVSIPVSCP